MYCQNVLMYSTRDSVFMFSKAAAAEGTDRGAEIGTETDDKRGWSGIAIKTEYSPVRQPPNAAPNPLG
jgi:hypothetical protein